MQRWSWAWLALVVCWPSATALAQSRAGLGDALLVEPDKSGCITHAAVLARVLHWLKPSIEIGDVQVLVRGRARPPSFVVRRGTGRPAERSFDVLPARCRDRVDAMALAIALALEEVARVESQGSKVGPLPDAGSAAVPAPGPAPTPNRVPSSGLELQPGWDRVLPGSRAGAGVAASAPPRAAPEPNPSREADPDAPPTAPERTAAEPATASSPRAGHPDAADATGDGETTFHVRLRAGVDGMIEALPEPVLGLHAGGELVLDRERRWSVGVDALVSSESETSHEGGRVLARLYAGRVIACFGWPVGDTALEGCAGMGLGVAAAQGKGFAPPEQSTTLFWASALARAALRYPRESVVGGRLAVDGLVNLARPKYRVYGVEDDLSTAPLGAAASLELIVALE